MSNPVRNVFNRSDLIDTDSRMTLTGSITKIACLLGTLVVGGIFGAYLAATQPAGLLTTLLVVVPLATFACAIVTFFKPQIAKYTGLLYAFGQGISFTIISLFFEARYPGIATTAVTLTCATALAMLVLYTFEIIKVTDRLRSIIVTATSAVALTYVGALLLNMFGLNTLGIFTSSSVYSIGFSLFVVGLAAFNLLLDFALIEEGVAKGLPKYMEWFGAFNLLVTLVWLYLEMVRLLAKISRRK